MDVSTIGFIPRPRILASKDTGDHGWGINNIAGIINLEESK